MQYIAETMWAFLEGVTISIVSNNCQKFVFNNLHLMSNNREQLYYTGTRLPKRIFTVLNSTVTNKFFLVVDLHKKTIAGEGCDQNSVVTRHNLFWNIWAIYQKMNIRINSQLCNWFSYIFMNSVRDALPNISHMHIYIPAAGKDAWIF